MNSNQSLRTRLHNGETLIGTILTLPCPEIAEMMSKIGFDWLFVDFEHSAMTTETVQRMLQAAGQATACAVRCPTIDEVWIKKCLDIGAHGLIIPQVRTRADVEKVVNYAKYPPRGRRGVGAGRAHAYGLRFQEYLDTANDDIALIVQIENTEAVQAIDDILQVDAVDCFFVGPYDLSASMGKTGRVHDPEVVEVINKVHDACRASAKPMGIFGATPDAVRPYMGKGYQLIAVATDISLLSHTAAQTLRSLR